MYFKVSSAAEYLSRRTPKGAYSSGFGLASFAEKLFETPMIMEPFKSENLGLPGLALSPTPRQRGGEPRRPRNRKAPNWPRGG